MPKSSRHKSHKQSKHSSKDYSDSEEDAIKMKERSNKDEGSTRAHRDSASGEKRKISSQMREGREGKDSIDHANGEILEYASSKRRKEKAVVVVGGDRWNGGGDEKEIIDRTVEKEVHKRASLKTDDKFKENSSKGESTKLESKNKSKRNESEVGTDRKEDGFTSVVAEKEEGKRRSSIRKEGKESKDKDRRSNKERNGGQETKTEDTEVKVVDWDAGKKPGIPLTILTEEKQYKRSRDNAERIPHIELRSPDVEKDHEKRIRRKREGSSEREKHLDFSKEGDERRASVKGDHKDLRQRDGKYKDGGYSDKYLEDGPKDDRRKDEKYKDGGYSDKYLEDGHKDDRRKDEKYKDGGYSDNYLEDGHKDDRRKDEKYRQEADKDNKYYDDKHQDDGEKGTRRRDYKYREDGDRDSRRKEDKHRDDGERDGKRKDEKYREGTEREGRRDDKHHDDGDRNNRRRDDCYYEDSDKEIRRGDDRFPEDGDRDDKRRGYSYRDDGEKENRHKDEKYREDPEKNRHKDSKLGSEVDREKRQREIKYEHASRDRNGDRSDPKRSVDDGYSVNHSRKLSAYDESPTHDDRTMRYRDDQNRRRTTEKEDYADTKPRSTKDQRYDTDKKNSKMDSVADRVRSTSRNADADHSNFSRKRSPPPSNSHGNRDHYRGMKQDESKYRDYNYEERPRHSSISTREYPGVGGSEKTAARSFEKPPQKGDGQLHELSAERRLKSDILSPPKQMIGGSRDWKEYSSKEGRGSRELGVDVAPGDEHIQADADTSAVSSPFAKNNNFSGSFKSLPPPPHSRTGMDSPLPMGSADDDGRSKSHIRHRRISDPNMGRIQGSPWRGVPSWPSPMPNRFLPFPHGPPPVSFHSVMQPFTAPPMFGVRPSLELNRLSPYHMPDPERFSGPGRPMGWHNQVDDTCPPLHAWNGSNTVFSDESRIYGRPDWDQSRNGPSGRGWDTTDDMWKGQNRNKTLEISSFEKDYNSPRSCDEAGQSLQSIQNEQTRVDQLADIADISLSTKIFEMNDVGAPVNSMEDVNDGKARKEDVCMQVYLSKLDISPDLAESELFTKCANLIDMDRTTVPDANDSKILYVEDVEAKLGSHRLTSTTLFPSIDGSVFQRSMSLYKKLKPSLQPEDVAKPKVLFELDLKSDPNNQDGADDKPKELCTIDDVQFESDTKHCLQKSDEHSEPVQQTVDQCVADRMRASAEGPDSAVARVNIDALKEVDVEKHPLPVETIEGGSDGPSPSPMDQHAGVNEEPDFTKCGILRNSDVVSEAIMPESVVPGSVHLSRIHHSPESTH